MNGENAHSERTPSDEPGPFSKLVDVEWQQLLDKDDRTSPEEYPGHCLITRNELASAMFEAWFGREAASPEGLGVPQEEQDPLSIAEARAEKAEAEREALIKHMVDRFLGWKLPENFRPDCGIHFDADAAKKLNPRNGRYEPNGTNLLDATQAQAMVRHMLGES
jgi:hypothetical protein